MENQSKISWVLVGVKPAGEGKISSETLDRLTYESFAEGRIYTLFLCGMAMDKTGTLEEMEEGYLVLKENMKTYNEGDYCIISTHNEASLLFLPTIMEEDAKDLSRDTDNL